MPEYGKAHRVSRLRTFGHIGELQDVRGGQVRAISARRTSPGGALSTKAERAAFLDMMVECACS